MTVFKTTRPDRLIEDVRQFRPQVVVLGDRFGRPDLSFTAVVPLLHETFTGLRVIVTSKQSASEMHFVKNPLNWGAFAVVTEDEVLQRKSLALSVEKAAGYQASLR